MSAMRVTATNLFLSGLLGIGLVAAPPSVAQQRSFELPWAPTVDRFYVTRGEQPLWLRNGAAINLLLETLERGALDGLSTGPQLALSARAALERASSGDPADAAEAERLLSAAWVLYVQALARPVDGIIFADPKLKPAVSTATAILAEAAAAPLLAEHVQRVSARNPIYAALRDAAWRDLSFLGEPTRRMRTNLDRARILPATGRAVVVDLASQRLFMMQDGTPVDEMRVIVGKPDMATPLMAGTVTAMTFNPYWNVPVDLAQKNIAPNVLRNGVGWLEQKGYEVLASWNDPAEVIDPATFDWKAVAAGKAEVRVRQKPGHHNMMGGLKIAFPNELGIYLHDTPDRALFEQSRRTFSSGCVRLEDAKRLGRWLLKGREPEPLNGHPESPLALPEAVPVYLTYLTAQPGADGTLAILDDFYGLDGEPGGTRVARTAS